MTKEYSIVFDEEILLFEFEIKKNTKRQKLNINKLRNKIKAVFTTLRLAVCISYH
jgi:hypothetical protein